MTVHDLHETKILTALAQTIIVSNPHKMMFAATAPAKLDLLARTVMLLHVTVFVPNAQMPRLTIATMRVDVFVPPDFLVLIVPLLTTALALLSQLL